MHVAQACLENVSTSKFLSLANLYPDLFSRLHIHYVLTVGSKKHKKKQNTENTETVYHHFIECPPFRDNYSSLWPNLKTKIINFNQTDVITKSDFITNLDPHKKFYYCWEDSVSLLMMLR